MTTVTKSLLAVSIIGFALGWTDFAWGLGKPIGAIFFGLFLISKVMEKETAAFNEEQKRQRESLRKNTPNDPSSRQSSPAEKWAHAH